MATLNLESSRDLLQSFDFATLFTDPLGWRHPPAPLHESVSVGEALFSLTRIAMLGGVMVLEVRAPDGEIPDAKTRASVHRVVSQRHHENLLIFVDTARTRSLWYWVKREGRKTFPRDHHFVKGQPGDLFLAKLSAMVVDMGELDERGDLDVTAAARRLQAALDVERVTKKFYADYKTLHGSFVEKIQGIDHEPDRRWYASVLLNRLMFVYFLQAKGFLEHGERQYLQKKLAGIGEAGFYETFLKALFFTAFAKPDGHPDKVAALPLTGTVPYLNGGLFLPHPIELRWPDIRIPDAAFEEIMALFTRYSWQLDDTPGGKDDEISPYVLGYIFEKYINQKGYGAYYTRPEITDYLCEQTIHRRVLDRVHELTGRRFEALGELMIRLDDDLCKALLHEILPRLSLLDPACGSGAFLVAALKTLTNLYRGVIGHISLTTDRALTDWLKRVQAEHKSIAYFVKRQIITQNLYGVDLMEEGVEIAKLRLFLALVSSAQAVDELEPLPNIDFNLLTGNSLIGLLAVDDNAFNDRYGVGDLFSKSYATLLKEKAAAIRAYQSFSTQVGGDLAALRKDIDAKRAEALPILNAVLWENFKAVGVRQVEEATWDEAKATEGKPQKRPLLDTDIAALGPFHWGYEFAEIVQERGGFDCIITNPPWDIFKPNSKEFLQEHDAGIAINNTSIKEFEEKKAELMADPAIRAAWLAYLSRFPHVSLYYRSAPQYANQISVVNGKKAGTDINLYKLFLEQCFNLLCENGQCGIVIPSGIYTDLGAKQLRELLFTRTKITSLFGLSNERFIFEGVDHRFKLCLLTFGKGTPTTTFSAAFRINPREAVGKDQLESFFANPSNRLPFRVDTIRRLSPDSLSIPEFKNETDASIAEKLAQFPRLGEKLPNTWNLVLAREFDMTNDSHLFRTEPGPGRLPLYEGKMIHQFTADFAKPRYWVEEAEGRTNLLGKTPDTGQTLDYQRYRLAFRDVARNTDERTMIATVVPQNCITGNTLIVSKEPQQVAELLAITALLNSYIADSSLRQRVSAHCNMFYVYGTPVPRLTASHPWFWPMVSRAARLICTAPEFDDLARDVEKAGGKQVGKLVGATNEVERARLRAELDGMVAHLYGLTEAELVHILATFPLIQDGVKLAVRNAYRDIERGMIVPPV